MALVPLDGYVFEEPALDGTNESNQRRGKLRDSFMNDRMERGGGTCDRCGGDDNRVVAKGEYLSPSSPTGYEFI